MLKAVGTTGDGRPLLLLGLSGENVTRLAAGEPIVFDLAEVGMAACQVVICYGRDEADLVRQLVLDGLLDPALYGYPGIGGPG